MTSTRRQDYSMCRYRLIKHFPGFLQAVPLPATQAVIRSLNVFIAGEYIVRYLKEGVEPQGYDRDIQFSWKTYLLYGRR